MENKTRRNIGFTLVELLIVVAIISFLAALAIPQFRWFYLKSQRAEAVILLSALHKGEMSYFSSYDHFYPQGNGSVVPAIGNAYFGLGGAITSSGWKFDDYSGFDGGIPDGISEGYLAGIRKNLDNDPSDIDHFYVQMKTPLSPLCPESIPFLYQDDLLNKFNC